MNNAGVLLDYSGDSDGSIFNAKVNTLRETMQTNLYGPLMLCQALIPLMKQQNYGRVVNVSSGAGRRRANRRLTIAIASLLIGSHLIKGVKTSRDLV